MMPFTGLQGTRFEDLFSCVSSLKRWKRDSERTLFLPVSADPLSVPLHQRSGFHHLHYTVPRIVHQHDRQLSLRLSCTKASLLPCVWNFLHKNTIYMAPLRVITTHTVLNRIWISRLRDQFSMYSRSRRTTVSKSRILLRPLTCQRPVIPGRVDILDL